MQSIFEYIILGRIFLSNSAIRPAFESFAIIHLRNEKLKM